MKVFLDDERVDVHDALLGPALAAGAARAQERGRVIIEVSADGQAVPPGHLDEPPSTAPYADELHLVSVDPVLFVKTTLLDAADALQQNRAEQADAARLLQVGQTKDALLKLGEVLSVWDAVRQAVQGGCELLGYDLVEALSAAADRTDMPAQLGAQLTEIKRCVNAEDWSALADTLEYDMDEQAARWLTTLKSLAERVSLEKH